MLIKEFKDIKSEVLRLKEELERLREELRTARIKELLQREQKCQIEEWN